jgi:predicted RNA binding protein YcfA (HicA-like mRNA interferase family)
MGKLSSISTKDALYVFKTLGFVVVSQTGSHLKMRRENTGRVETIIIPNHKILKEGTLKNGILRPIGVSPEQFIKLL